MKKAITALLVLLLLVGTVYAAEDTPFGDLSNESKVIADRVKDAGMKPLKMILYIISGLGGIIGALFSVITGYGWMKAKNAQERTVHEDRLKNIVIGTFLIIFGPFIIMAFVG